MSIRPHRKLEVWKEGMELVKEIYTATSAFPEEEKFSLTSQLRRAAVSVPSNIAEGAARQTTKEYIRFLYIASGSLSEIETQIEIAHQLGFLEEPESNSILNRTSRISALLSGLIRSLNQRNP